jgi:hypothetical protein
MIPMHLFLFLLTFLFPQNALAFKIKIIDSTLELDRGMNSTTATIVNDSENMIAIEASARVRRYNQDGSEDLELLADDLIIVPGQMIIPPNGEQVSIDEDKLKGIDPSGQKAGVVINYRIGKSFYVKPKNTQSNISLKGVQKFTQEGAEGLRLSLENIGTEHQIAHVMNVEFTTASGEKITAVFTKTEMGNSINFLAKSERNVIVPVPAELKGQDIVSATLVSFDPATAE